MRSNEAMERSRAHDGRRRRGGRLQTAEKEVKIVSGEMFARRSLPGRWASDCAAYEAGLEGKWLHIPDLCHC
jgi:hypothetical protein